MTSKIFHLVISPTQSLLSRIQQIYVEEEQWHWTEREGVFKGFDKATNQA
jgi:hypothetical protein